MPAYKTVVIQIRISRVDTVDFFHLSRREFFVRVETPAALKQALAPQNFMQARDASPETICSIEERRVAVGDMHSKGKRVTGSRGSHPGVQFHRFAGPDGPVAQQ